MATAGRHDRCICAGYDGLICETLQNVLVRVHEVQSLKNLEVANQVSVSRERGVLKTSRARLPLVYNISTILRLQTRSPTHHDFSKAENGVETFIYIGAGRVQKLSGLQILSSVPFARLILLLFTRSSVYVDV